MNVTWHEESRQWLMRPESAEDGGRIRRLPARRWDTILKGWWVPEICWHDLAAWPWPAGASPVARYQRPPGGPPTDLQHLQALPFPPLDFQAGGVSLIVSRARCLLGDDMGLGKTPQALWGYDELRRRGVVDLLVVICTKRKVGDWQDDFAKFLQRTPDTGELRVHHYEAASGRSKTEAPNVAHTLNLMRLKRAMLVIDEVHHVASYTSQRHKAVAAFAGLAARRVGLSGTPVRNRPESFLPVYTLLTGATVTRDEFLGKFCHLRQGRVVDYKRNLGELHAVFQQFGLARQKSEVTTLPPPVLIPSRVRLEGRQRQLYNEFRQECRVKLRGMGGEEFTVAVRRGQLLPMFTRLLQLASHPGMLGDGIEEGSLAKFRLLDELVEEAGDQKILVWDSHPAVLDRIAARYPTYRPAILHGQRTDSQNDADRARFLADPNCRLAAISILAFGEGLNLQAASVALFHGLVWNYEKVIQAMARIDRIGQVRVPTMIFLLAEGTIEEYVFETLQRKHRWSGMITQGATADWGLQWNDGDWNRDRLLEALGRSA